MYIEPPFDDIHPVIKMFMKMKMDSEDCYQLLRWVIDTYESHPDSPFVKEEIERYKNRLIKE